ncbi:MAG: hypothetical protein OXF86_06040 [Caldilineaceae bacterium]|nr:hypothetical protein [Caldilineaceae bacterium]
MSGQLFTRCFLDKGIFQTDDYRAYVSQKPDLDTFRAQAFAVLENASRFPAIDEATTEMELIRPLFRLFGWTYYLPRQGSDLNQNIPDHLLFAGAESKARVAAKPAPQRFPDALAVAESKRYDLPPDVLDGI